MLAFVKKCKRILTAVEISFLCDICRLITVGSDEEYTDVGRIHDGQISC